MTNQPGAANVAPNAAYLDGTTPLIDWDGQQWPVPELAPRENRLVIPAVLRLGPVLNSLKEHLLSTEQYDDILLIIYWGLKRAHPMLRREYFDGVAFGFKDMIKAINVVAVQTGVVERKKPDAPVPLAPAPVVPAAEAPAPQTPQTGTP